MDSTSLDHYIDEECLFKLGDIVPCFSSRYQIKKLLGQGVAGVVAQCTKLGTEEMVALKISSENCFDLWVNEVMVDAQLRKLDQNKTNLVRLIEPFLHLDQGFLAFELLDKDLYALVEESPEPMSLSAIRVIAQQLLVALNALKSIDVVHADIKPDNILLVNHELQPFKVKLIDFGLAQQRPNMLKTTTQPPGYMAPEVLLGLPLSDAIDMWGLGCVLAYLCLGDDLYPYLSEGKVMTAIVQMQGMPEDHLLNNGSDVRDIFEDDCPIGPWRLRRDLLQPIESGFHKFNSLDDLARPEVKDATEYEDTQAFLSLLKCMLQVDPKKRITPSEALEHTFITMKHFPSDTNNEYVKSALLTMKKVEEIVEIDTNTNNGPPATAGLDDATAAGTNKNPPGTNEAASPTSVQLNSDGINTSRDEGTTGFVKVKTQKKWFKRIMSRIIKCVRCQQEQSSVESMHSVTRTAAGNNDVPPATASLDDATAAGTNANPSGTNEAASPTSVNLNSDGINTSGDEGTTGFVKVRTQKKWFKRVRQFFSRMTKSLNC